MTRALALLCLALTLPTAAAATVLRSGEHGAFTRLAFAAGGALVWTVSQEGDAAAIRFEPAPAFDLARIYERIDRARIASVEQDGDALVLRFGCRCGVEVVRAGGGMIAIDVAPLPEGVEMPPEAPEAVAAVPPAEAVRAADLSPVTIPLILPPRDFPLAPRLARASRERLIAPGAPARAAPPPPEGATPPEQVRLRDGRSADRRADAPDPLGRGEPSACVGAGRLPALLAQTPEAAEAALADRLAAYDPADGRSAAMLRDALHAASRPLEAAHLAHARGIHDRWSALLLAASGEGTAPPGGALVDGCGPAALLLSLAAAPPDRRLPEEARRALLELVQDMHAARRTALLARAAAHVRLVGMDGLAAEIETRTPPEYEGPPVYDPAAHGAALAARLGPDRAAAALPPRALAEAEGLVGELPEGDVRGTLETALIRAALHGGDWSAAAARLERAAPELRASALGRAARDLRAASGPEAVVAATALLRWREAMPAQGRAALAALVRDAGYSSIADRWQPAGPDAPVLVTVASPPGPEAAAWLSRDLAAAAAAGDGPRSRIAAHLLAGDPEAAPGTIAGARARLDRGRTAAAHVAALLRDTGGETDP
ncbi:hypothetical protein [Jannaschia sp. W003]|uniref:hypothetical protein n=1 Tax=Jannaschia sp. W003 TaxID=2867012 RepID=UPI0021A5F15B|nr:hypothetical protein [Jannaschia sp. W003]UWQ21826.1 hypothetical protein K3554_02000 [Jannaschia sp. W003]